MIAVVVVVVYHLIQSRGYVMVILILSKYPSLQAPYPGEFIGKASLYDVHGDVRLKELLDVGEGEGNLREN